MSGGRSWTPKNIARNITFGRQPYITYAPAPGSRPVGKRGPIVPLGSIYLPDKKKPPFVVAPISSVLGLADGTVNLPLTKSPYIYEAKSHPKGKKPVLFNYTNYLTGINGNLLTEEFSTFADYIHSRRIVTSRGVEALVGYACCDASDTGLYVLAASAYSDEFGGNNVSTHLDKVSLLGVAGRVVDIQYLSGPLTLNITIFHDTEGEVSFPDIFPGISNNYDLPQVLSCCLSPDGKYFSSVFLFSKEIGSGAEATVEYTIVDVIIALDRFGVASTESGITLASGSGKTNYLSAISSGSSVNVNTFTFKMYLVKSIDISANSRTTLATITQFVEKEVPNPDGSGGTIIIPAVDRDVIKDTGNTVTTITPTSVGTPVAGVVYSSVANETGVYTRYWIDITFSNMNSSGLPIEGSDQYTDSYEYIFYQDAGSGDYGVTDGYTGASYPTTNPGSAEEINSYLPGRKKITTYSPLGVGIGYVMYVNGFHICSRVIVPNSNAGVINEYSFKSELVYHSSNEDTDSYLVTIPSLKQLVFVDGSPPTYLGQFYSEINRNYTFIAPNGDDVSFFTGYVSKYMPRIEVDANLSTSQLENIAEVYVNGAKGTYNGEILSQHILYKSNLSGGGLSIFYVGPIVSTPTNNQITPDIVNYPSMTGFTKNVANTSVSNIDRVSNWITSGSPGFDSFYERLSDDFEFLVMNVDGSSSLVFVNGVQALSLQHVENLPNSVCVAGYSL